MIYEYTKGLAFACKPPDTKIRRILTLRFRVFCTIKEGRAMKSHSYILIIPELPYPEAQQLQRFFLNYVKLNPSCGGVILLTSHAPCYTVGKALQIEDVPEVPLWPVYPTERGGQLTFHHPEQMVCYPIIRLSSPNVLAFMKQVLEWGNQLMDALGLNVLRDEDETGVWLQTPLRPNGRGKVASLGLAVKHWITYHGLAINVNVPAVMWESLPHGLYPCGLSADTPFNLKDACPEITREKAEALFLQVLLASPEWGNSSIHRLEEATTATDYWQQVQKLLQ
jgi:lipoyl(octanoyl) transferase